MQRLNDTVTFESWHADMDAPLWDRASPEHDRQIAESEMAIFNTARRNV